MRATTADRRPPINPDAQLRMVCASSRALRVDRCRADAETCTTLGKYSSTSLTNSAMASQDAEMRPSQFAVVYCAYCSPFVCRLSPPSTFQSVRIGSISSCQDRFVWAHAPSHSATSGPPGGHCNGGSCRAVIPSILARAAMPASLTCLVRPMSEQHSAVSNAGRVRAADPQRSGAATALLEQHVYM